MASTSVQPYFFLYHAAASAMSMQAFTPSLSRTSVPER